MSYENKPGTGALFKQDKKSEKAPDYKGPYYDYDSNGNVIEREIAAWIRKSASGKTYMSLKVGDKFVPAKRDQSATPPPSDGFSDDIPFAPRTDIA